MAYCLMGLFDVNMPLLYGEGSKAFHRLQLEIIKSSTDQSIFAWESQDPDADLGGPWTLPLFALEPSMFRHAGKIKDSRFAADFLSPYTMTNKGLQIQAKLVPAREYTEATRSEKLLLLNCYREEYPSDIELAVFLNQVNEGSDTFTRCRKNLYFVKEKLSREAKFVNETPIYINNNSPYIDSRINDSNVTSVLLNVRSVLKDGFTITKKQYKDGRMDHNIMAEHSGTWEGDYQIIRFPDNRSLQVDCTNEKKCFVLQSAKSYGR
jgi:hypothetical protein